MLKKVILSMIIISSVVFAGKFPVSSIEYSVTLKADKFQNGISDVEIFKKSLFDTISVARLDNDRVKLESEEVVSFWDSEDQMFQKKNIIVRLRGEGDKFEITLKYRGNDQESAENWDLLASDKAKSKTEIDRYVDRDAFSRSMTVLTKENALNAKLLLEMFPGLKEYGLTPEIGIKKINGFFVNSTNYEIGEYRFGAEKAKKKTTTSNFDLTVWKCANGKVVTAQLSWKIRNEGIEMKSALNHAREVMEKLTQVTEWADANPKTKTSISYDSNSCK